MPCEAPVTIAVFCVFAKAGPLLMAVPLDVPGSLRSLFEKSPFFAYFQKPKSLARARSCRKSQRLRSMPPP